MTDGFEIPHVGLTRLTKATWTSLVVEQVIVKCVSQVKIADRDKVKVACLRVRDQWDHNLPLVPMIHHLFAERRTSLRSRDLSFQFFLIDLFDLIAVLFLLFHSTNVCSDRHIIIFRRLHHRPANISLEILKSGNLYGRREALPWPHGHQESSLMMMKKKNVAAPQWSLLENLLKSVACLTSRAFGALAGLWLWVRGEFNVFRCHAIIIVFIDGPSKLKGNH